METKNYVWKKWLSISTDEVIKLTNLRLPKMTCLWYGVVKLFKTTKRYFPRMLATECTTN